MYRLKQRSLSILFLIANEFIFSILIAQPPASEEERSGLRRIRQQQQEQIQQQLQWQREEPLQEPIQRVEGPDLEELLQQQNQQQQNQYKREQQEEQLRTPRDQISK